MWGGDGGTQEVLIELKIALVGLQAGKLGSHGDIPPLLPQGLHLAAHHTGQVSTIPLSLPDKHHPLPPDKKSKSKCNKTQGM